jgi:CHAT domain-containing protein
VQAQYVQSGSLAKNVGRLRLRLVTSKENASLPLECLFDGNDYLVLRHPVSRIVMGADLRPRGVIAPPLLLNRLWAKLEKVRVLLIAANTPPHIPQVDVEVKGLLELLAGLFRGQGDVQVIASEAATLDGVTSTIERLRPHIVHFAGHGHHEKGAPERSFIQLRDGSINAIRLAAILSDAGTSLVYLSCCEGAATAAPQALLNDDFLGIADALVRKGVPAVVGFRWPVVDASAAKFATSFYGALADYGDAERAVFEARRNCDRDDITWLSPILIFHGD